LVAVSARIFLPSDMSAPAPITSEGISSATPSLNYFLSTKNF
jgi:hypothetical protein